MCPILRRVRGGSSVPLLAGAGANYTSAFGGAFAFHVNGLPSYAWWNDGSSYFSSSISIVYYIYD